MADSLSHSTTPLEVGISAMALAGEAESGDAHVVTYYEGGAAIAVIDGLGHGPSAAHAARIAAEVFRNKPQELPVKQLERCHRALRATRGVAMTIVTLNFDQETLDWVGVGNVDARLFRVPSETETFAPFPPPSECVLLLGGIVGFRLPALRASTLAIHKGDLLVLATDGISASFGDTVILGDHPQRTTERIMHSHRKQDDALVLAARYLGKPA
ncbi:MAG: SpoIIE family protein phosphatase [Actinomycetota bacterium]